MTCGSQNKQMTEQWVAKNICFSQIFSTYKLQHIINIGSQKVDNIALNFFYLLFLYRCDPAGALFLRNLGPWSLGSIKWVIFLCFCLNPELGSKWRWWGMPSNFLIPHTIILSFELNEVGVNHSMFKCRAHSFIHCSPKCCISAFRVITDSFVFASQHCLSICCVHFCSIHPRGPVSPDWPLVIWSQYIYYRGT